MRMIKKTSHFIKCAINDPDPYINKQYLPAINNAVFTKLKSLFLHYSTTSTIKNLEKEVDTTNKLLEENKARTNRWSEEA